jgi:hypothetical protein
MIATNLHPFFWDIDIGDFDPRSYPRYTILRLLEYGTIEAFHWLKEQFPEEMIMDIVRNEPNLSPRTATFWALFYHIPSEEIAALRDQVVDQISFQD